MGLLDFENKTVFTCFKLQDDCNSPVSEFSFQRLRQGLASEWQTGCDKFGSEFRTEEGWVEGLGLDSGV